MLDQIPQWSEILQTTLLLLVGILGLSVSFVFLTRRSAPFPRVGKPWLLSLLSGPWAMSFTMEKHLQTGYDRVIKKTSKPFLMRWWGLDYIFLPPKYLGDLNRSLRRTDAHGLSFFESLNEAFSLDASVGDLYSSNLMIDVVKFGLNPRLAKIAPLLESEATYAFTKEIGTPEDWTPFPAAQLLNNIVLRTTSRILIGPELCRDDNFLKSFQDFGISIFNNGLLCSILPPLPGFLRRPLRRLFTPLFHKRSLDRAIQLVQPTVQARFDKDKFHPSTSPSLSSDPELELEDAIEWTLSLTKSIHPAEQNPERITLTLLLNLWASNAGPAETLTNMIFQILYDPVYLPALRSEAEESFRVNGSYTDNALSLHDMPLLDSFIREINRLYPTDSVTCMRTVTNNNNGFELHDGLRLPVGSRMAVPSRAIQTDVDNYADPLRFDGFRFARMRKSKRPQRGSSGGFDKKDIKLLLEEAKKYSATALSETYLPFGFGRHACPGRWYAILMIKIIFTKLILEYDLKWDLNEGVIQKVRPASLSLNGMFLPNQKQQVWLRRRNSSMKSSN
ncbi:cytochrome P450 [Rhypophila decipiens]|uniref:Cytochrome P450 n=1 Tax=Rhypophila decipiens TaxID=261697 RepID=A0AAN6XSP3_9PEZI|nr:cytochrome P450 [Rhypophila decipiens]